MTSPTVPPRYAFRLEDLRVFHLVTASCHACARRRGLRLQLLYIGGDVMRPDPPSARQAALLATAEELAPHASDVGSTRRLVECRLVL